MASGRIALVAVIAFVALAGMGSFLLVRPNASTVNAVELRATQPDDIGPSVPEPGQASFIPLPQSEPPAAPRPVDDDRPADAVAPAPRAKAQNVRNDDESERSAGAADDDSDDLDDTADDDEDDDGD